MGNALFDAVLETSNATRTTNGMKAWKSSLNKVLDLFSKGSSLRKNPNAVRNMVREAYVEDKLSTLRCLFYLRDIRGNGGGNSLYSAEFIKNLNGYCEENPYTTIELITPLHKKSKELKTKDWVVHNKNNIELEKATFNGKLIVLTDYYCASSAEETINFTKSLKNVIRVGTNTNGCNCFTNLWVCILPKTYMAIFLPNVAILDMFEEGKGFEPDYWLDTTEPLEEIKNWLKSNDV